MNRLWFFPAAAVALTILQPDSAFAQRGGARAGGRAAGLHGLAANRGTTAGHPGVPVATTGIYGGVGRPGWGWRRGWGRPAIVGVTAGGLGYVDSLSYAGNDECLFWTHRGWINTCFDWPTR